MKLSVPLQFEFFARPDRPVPNDSLPSLLIVSKNEQPHVIAHHLLPSCGWDVSSAFTIQDAENLMRDHETPVLLCDRELENGNWRALLESLQSCPRPSRVIVFSRAADPALWAEVMNVGGYDLLLYPFEPEELRRVTALALDSWRREAPHCIYPSPARKMPGRAAAASQSCCGEMPARKLR